MVGKTHFQGLIGEWPLTPLATGFQGDEPLVGQGDEARGEAKLVVEVNRKCYRNVFSACESAFQHA
ncbi:hypothetical protein ABIC89_003681 [Variovorax boronicumulans]|uniref:hypothetical protein n=1 Tax=Variovorax boronicumulans TaxID=436515 RepID=UPI003489E2B7